MLLLSCSLRRRPPWRSCSWQRAWLHSRVRPSNIGQVDKLLQEPANNQCRGDLHRNNKQTVPRVGLYGELFWQGRDACMHVNLVAQCLHAMCGVTRVNKT